MDPTIEPGLLNKLFPRDYEGLIEGSQKPCELETVDPSTIETIDIVKEKNNCKTCKIRLLRVMSFDHMVATPLGLLGLRTFDEEKQKFQYYSYCERCFTLYQQR